MNNEKIKQELVFFGRMFEEKGLLNALEGNLSIIDREDGNKLYITPSAKSKMLLTEEMIPVLSKDDVQIDGTLKRSSEYKLHRVALDIRKDCGACIHSHAPYLSAFAFCEKDIEIKCTSSFYLGYAGKIPCLPYGEPGTPEIYDGIESLIKENNVILLGNHGVLCVGKDVEECLRLLEGAETIVKTYFLALKAGTPKELPPEKAASLLVNHPFGKFYKGKV